MALRGEQGSGTTTVTGFPATIGAAVSNAYTVMSGGVVSGLAQSNTTAAATANTSAIQAALTAGGLVQITQPGTYYVNKTLLQPSNSQLLMGQGVTLKLFANAACNILRNVNAGVTITAASFVRASNVVTVTEPGHPRNVGDVVFVANLATDTSFNGLQTITAVTSSTWTYASSGSNGSPTGFGYLTPANVRLAAANFVRATNIVTVTETGHSRQVGDSVYIANLAADTSFNGTYQITASTPGVSWTYASTGSNGSPTGTGVVAGDNNLGVVGGAIDGNKVNQPTGSGSYVNVSACFGVIYGNVGRLSVQNVSGLYQTKYCYWVYNATDVNFVNCYFNTPSDCIHFEGPGDRLNVSQIFGNSGDDVVAFTNTNGASAGSYLGFASPSGLGNFGVCKVEGIFPSNSDAPALVKVTGDASTSMRYLAINELNGTLSATGNHAVAIVDDTASLTGMSIAEVSIRNVFITGGNTVSNLLQLNASGVIGKIRAENLFWTSAHAGFYAVQIQSGTTNLKKLEIIGFKNNFNGSSSQSGILQQGTLTDLLIDQWEWQANTTSPMLALTNAGTITDLKITNGLMTGSAAAGYCITQSGTTTLTRAMFSDITVKAADSLFRQANTPTLGTVYLNNIYFDTCNLGLNTTSSFTAIANNVVANSLSNRLFQINSGTVRIDAKNMRMPAAAKMILFNVGGSVVSYSCSDASAGLDMGNPAATLAGETPVAGDLHWNTNATTGGLHGYSAAGSWVKVF